MRHLVAIDLKPHHGDANNGRDSIRLNIWCRYIAHGQSMKMNMYFRNMFEIVIFKRMQYDSCANYGFKPIEDRILNGA